MGPAPRSPVLREAIRIVGSVLLVTAWTLVTFYPEGGLESAQATVVRGGIALVAALVLVAVLSVPLRALRLVAWSPPLDLYARMRDARRQRVEAVHRERQQRREAPYRAIQSLDVG